MKTLPSDVRVLEVVHHNKMVYNGCMKKGILTDLTRVKPMSRGVILADPPWNWTAYGRKGKGRSAEAYYDVMKLEDIKTVPVSYYAKPDCILFLWIHNSMLPQGLEVMQAWGFEYKARGFTWLKTVQDGSHLKMGMGKWTRMTSELCILGTRGHPKRKSASVLDTFETWEDIDSTIAAPIREHSRKPDEIYPLIERLCYGPYLELFASRESEHRNGWTRYSGKDRSSVRRWASDGYPDETFPVT